LVAEPAIQVTDNKMPINIQRSVDIAAEISPVPVLHNPALSNRKGTREK
jgi:hypothetical protein